MPTDPHDLRNKVRKVINTYILFLQPADRSEVTERLRMLVEDERRAAAENMRERCIETIVDSPSPVRTQIIQAIKALPLDTPERSG